MDTQTKQTVSTDQIFVGNDRLRDFATELSRQLDGKKDFKVPSQGQFCFHRDEEGNYRFDLGPVIRPGKALERRDFKINDFAHGQIADKLAIPRKYYNRMRESAPILLLGSVNHWFKKEPKDLLIRTLDGDVRAVLSDRFRALDNYDLMNTVLPIIQDQKLRIIESALTDRRLYLKAVFEEVQGEVAVGDVVQSGLIIQNSEVGCGALSIGLFLWRLVCLNGMVGPSSIRQYHLGKSGNGDGEDIRELVSSTTRRLEDMAFFSKIGDICKSTLSKENFEKQLEKFKAATGQPIKEPERVIEVVSDRFAFSKDERNDVLSNLISGGDNSRWGLANAITVAAKASTSYDRKVELETAGYQLIEIPYQDWTKISEGSLS